MKLLIAIVLLFMSISAQAVWLDISGKVESIITYAGNETVIVKISNNGNPVKECTNTTHFVISRGISPEARARMYSLLLAAKSTGGNVVISYNDVGGCESWNSNQNAYRKITRLR